MVRGMLIVVEGLDRAGKSTQCERLAANLEKAEYDIKRMRFPDRSTPIGKSIDAYLKGEAQIEDHVIHLLFSANRWEAASQIRDHISNGITIIIDRYSYSGAVYSAAKNNPELSLSWAWQMEAGLPKPDLCLFLDIDPQTAKARGGFGSERYENEAMQRKVRELFQELLSAPCAAGAAVIDAGQSLNFVERDVLLAIQKFVDSGRLRMGLGSLEPMR